LKAGNEEKVFREKARSPFRVVSKKGGKNSKNVDGVTLE